MLARLNVICDRHVNCHDCVGVRLVKDKKRVSTEQSRAQYFMQKLHFRYYWERLLSLRDGSIPLLRDANGWTFLKNIKSRKQQRLTPLFHNKQISKHGYHTELHRTTTCRLQPRDGRQLRRREPIIPLRMSHN